MPSYVPYGYQPYNPGYGYQQPQQIPQPQQQSPSGMIWVRNAQEAAMYPVAPNAAVALWDSGVSCIYLKQADASGRPTMKTYDLVERPETPQNAPQAQEGTTAYATKNELAALAGVVKGVDGVIAEIREELDAMKSPKKRKKEEEPDA